MTDTRPVLLVTRPEAASRRFLAQFCTRFGADWPAVVSPLSRTEFLTPDGTVPEAGALIFTSENGVRGYMRLGRAGRPRAWCVGQRTAEVAQAEGFPVFAGSGFAKDLVELVAGAAPVGPLLWPRGEEVAVDLTAVLAGRGLAVAPLVVYRQKALPLSPEAGTALAGCTAIVVPLFSPRSARLFVAAARSARAPLAIAALSPAIAAVAAGLAPAALRIAARPESGSVLDALDHLLADITGG